jgi:hypothetical protein
MRASLGGGEGGAPERDARVGSHQHGADRDPHGDDPPPPVRGGGTVASWGGDRPTPERRDGVGEDTHASPRRLDRVHDGSHLDLLADLRPDLDPTHSFVMRSNHGGETLTLAERAFGVKRKCERVFATNA